MFRLLKVRGESLTPLYQDGDFVLICCVQVLLENLKPGDMVVFDLPPYGTLIKQVESVDSQTDRIFVVGTHADSVDSRSFGPVDLNRVIGKVIGHVRRE